MASLQSALKVIAPLLAIFTPVTTAFEFIDCPANYTQNATVGLKEARDLAAGAIEALAMTYNADGTQKEVSYERPLDPNQAQAIYARYFGVIDSQEDTDNIAYVQGVFDRAHEVLSNKSLKIECLSRPDHPKRSHCNKNNLPGIAAFVNGREPDRINLCPLGMANVTNRFLAPGLAAATDPDELKATKALAGSGGHLFLHETLHLPYVGGDRHIGDVELMETWDHMQHVYCYGYRTLLLPSNPALAARNADNYAYFARDIRLATYNPSFLRLNPWVIALPTDSKEDKAALKCVLENMEANERDPDVDDSPCYEDLLSRVEEAEKTNGGRNPMMYATLTFGTTRMTTMTMSSLPPVEVATTTSEEEDEDEETSSLTRPPATIWTTMTVPISTAR